MAGQTVENPFDDQQDDPSAGQTEKGRRSVRMPPEARKTELLTRAIEFFSEEGFDGGTRALAQRIGITQPLIYRYFPSKEDLINEVYNAVYVSQWKDDWTTRLVDRSLPLQQRLTEFYRDYAHTIFNRTWMRIFFFAGLKGLDINTRYINRVMHGAIFYQGIREHVYGLPGQIDHDRSAQAAIKMYLGVAASEIPTAIAKT
jgi:AcrR family transcriptional regulator